MSFSSIFTILYGVLVFAGGVIGYIAAASLPSLAMGTGFGIVVTIAGFGMFYHKSWGLPLAMSMVFILTVFFTYRFVITMKAMPAGIMLALSLVTMSMLVKKLK